MIRNFQKRNFLWGKDIVEYEIENRGQWLEFNLDFAKGRSKLIVKKCNCLTREKC